MILDRSESRWKLTGTRIDESSGLYQTGEKLMEKGKVTDDAEIRVSGIEVLNKALGPAAALRFLTLLHREPTDYVEVSRRLYEGQTIEEIFERAKQHWEE